MLRWVASTVGTTVASPVLMDKVVAMNGGYRFLCSYPPENQKWQAGTSPSIYFVNGNCVNMETASMCSIIDTWDPGKPIMPIFRGDHAPEKLRIDFAAH